MTAAGGNEDRTVGGLRFGGRLGNNGHYRAYSKYIERRPLTNEDGERSSDDSDSLRSGFRADWTLSGRDSLTVEGDLFRAGSGTEFKLYQLKAPFQTVVNGVERATGGHALANWTRRQSSRSQTALRVYFDRSERYHPTLTRTHSTIDVDFQQDLALTESHNLVWGVGFRESVMRADGTFNLSFVPDHRNERLLSGFVQDQWTLYRDRLSLILGSKFEHKNFSGVNVQPTARLLWTPNAVNTVWASVSRAVRTPSYVENSIRVNVNAFAGQGGLPTAITLFGNPAFGQEDLCAYEFGYRVEAGKRFSIDLATFYNIYHHLSATVAEKPIFERVPQPSHLIIPLRQYNKMHGDAYGGEVAANWVITERWRLIPSYTWLRLEMLLDPGSQEIAATEGQSPRNAFQIRSNLDLSRRLQFDTAIYHVAALPSLDVGAYTRVDARLGYRPRPNFEISLGIQNLQGGRHVEFESIGPYTRATVGRSFQTKLTWGF